MGQNVFSQSDCRIFYSTISPEQVNFLNVDTSSHKSKVDEIFLGGHGQKLGMASLVIGL